MAEASLSEGFRIYNFLDFERLPIGKKNIITWFNLELESVRAPSSDEFDGMVC